MGGVAGTHRGCGGDLREPWCTTEDSSTGDGDLPTCFLWTTAPTSLSTPVYLLEPSSGDDQEIISIRTTKGDHTCTSRCIFPGNVPHDMG